MKIELVKALITDLDFLFQLRKSTMAPHLEKAGRYLSDAEHMSRVKFHFDNAFIVKLSYESVGLLKYVETTKTIEILQLQIGPNHQGKGVGKYVLKYMISLSKKQSKELTLKVLKENPAVQLYQRNGFLIIGEDQYEFFMKFGNVTN